MHALVLLCINQHTKLEGPSFTSKHNWGQNCKNGLCDPDHAHEGVLCNHKASWHRFF